LTNRIYHIALEKDFHRLSTGDKYTPASFEECGFVHCALRESVLQVANDYFGNVTERILLVCLDTSKLTAEVRYEAAVPEPGAGTGHLSTAALFPHVYGSIDLAAVCGLGVLRRGENGYVWPEGLK
jgi:uncharacterized protein